MSGFSNRNGNFYIVAGIIFSLLYVFIIPPVVGYLMQTILKLSWANGSMLFNSRIVYWVGLILIWMYAVKVEKRNLLIWEDREYSFSLYIKFMFAIFTVLIFGLSILQIFYSIVHINQVSSRLTEMMIVLKKYPFLLLFSALTAGVTEELIFRGYLQPRLEIVLKSPALAVLISSILFGLLHYGYGTLVNMLGPFFIGSVFAYFYWKYRNIKILIIFHFLWDLFSLLLLTRSHH